MGILWRKVRFYLASLVVKSDTWEMFIELGSTEEYESVNFLDLGLFPLATVLDR